MQTAIFSTLSGLYLKTPHLERRWTERPQPDITAQHGRDNLCFATRIKRSMPQTAWPRIALLVCLTCAWSGAVWAQPAARLRVFLDCDFCFEDYIVDEVDIVEYVRDPAEADIQIIVTESDTAGGGTERTVSFVGLGRFKGIDHSIRALTDSSDTEDTERSRLATAMTIGLLNYMSRAGVP